MTLLCSHKSRRALYSLLAFLLVLTGCTRSHKNLRQIPVVKVNQNVLTAGEFSDRLAERIRLFDDLSAKDPKILQKIKNLVVQDFVVQSLTKDWARRHQIFVRKEDLDAAVKKIQKQYPDELSFRKELADQGLTIDEWKDRLRMTILEHLVQSALLKDIPKPTTEEMQRYFADNKKNFKRPAAVHVYQIVVRTKANAQTIERVLRAGKSFAAMAKEFSVGPEGQTGGDLGWVYSDTSNIFTKRHYPIGQLEIAKDAFGYHVFKIVARRRSHSLTFQEAKPQIVRDLLAQSEQGVYKDWLRKQILKAHVYKNDDVINKIYVQNRGGN